MRWIVLVIVALHACMEGVEVKLLYTAAVIGADDEMRQSEYLHSLEVLKGLGVVPYVVEACCSASFFDACAGCVFYSKVNDASLKNKGVNEARSMLAALNFYQFDEEAMIVKLTGRYFFQDGYFFEAVKSDGESDAFVRRAPVQYPTSRFMGCFALRMKFFKRFLEGLDFEKMEREMICVEDELGRFLLGTPEIRIHEMEALHVTANIYGTGTPSLTRW